MTRLRWLALGALAMYFLDPQRGTSRPGAAISPHALSVAARSRNSSLSSRRHITETDPSSLPAASPSRTS